MDTTHQTDTTRRIAAAVTSALRASGITQDTAAERTGIARTTLKRRLSGLSPFKVSELDALATLCDTTVLALVQSAEDAA
jgi:transcriptional regulator with XRE-family HTH domain